jgi:transcriptional regulator
MTAFSTSHYYGTCSNILRSQVRFLKFELFDFLVRMFPVVVPHILCDTDVAFAQERRMADSKLDLLQGTLDLMVLQTLAAMGSLHGYGIARRIEQVSGDEILLNQGTIYASLVRLQQRGWISAEWGTSDNNRKAKYYSITKSGRKQLAADAAYWHRLSSVMGRMLAMPKEGEL